MHIITFFFRARTNNGYIYSDKIIYMNRLNDNRHFSFICTTHTPESGFHQMLLSNDVSIQNFNALF